MIDMIRRILEDKLYRDQHIRQFQEVIWNRGGEGPYFEILGALALGLDYYEPDESLRREDSSFYGEDRLEQEILQALRELEKLERRT